MKLKWNSVTFGVIFALTAASHAAEQNRGAIPSNRADSVVLADLRAQDAEVRKAIQGDGGLRQSVDGLRKTLADNTTKAKAALDRARREGTPEAVDAYHAVIANANNEIGRQLEQVLGLRDKVTKSVSDMSVTVDRVRKQFDVTFATVEKDAQRHEADTEKRRADLQALAQKYIKQDDPNPLTLPPDVELRIRQLGVEHDVAAMRAAVLRQGVERMQQAKVQLEQRAGMLSRVQQEVQLTFVRAQATVGLLGTAATVQVPIVKATQAIRTIDDLVTTADMGNLAIDDVNALIPVLVDPATMSTDSAPADAAASRIGQSAIDVLKRFLKGAGDGPR